MFNGIGMGELLIILVIVIIVFGATRLPSIGEGLGKGIKNFKKEITGAKKNLGATKDGDASENMDEIKNTEDSKKE